MRPNQSVVSDAPAEGDGLTESVPMTPNTIRQTSALAELALTEPGLSVSFPSAPSATDLYNAALTGGVCTVLTEGSLSRALPVRRWRSKADARDRVVLAHCIGSTIDLGCGPGRMAEELQRCGMTVMAVDVAAEAVSQARRRGVYTIQRDILGPLPREGTWDTALLADGNIGIGGNPSHLLSRIHGLLSSGGRVVVDLAPPGTGLQQHFLSLAVGGRTSRPFPWALVGADALPALAMDSGFAVRAVHEWSGRWFAVLDKEAGLPCPG